MTKFRDLGKAEKIHLVITNILRITIIIAIVSAIFGQKWVVLFVSSLTLVLTFIPAMIEKSLSVDLPVEFEFLIVIFIYAALFLGDVHGYYTRFWWWDIILHTGASLTLGLFGFLMMYVLYKRNKIHAKPFTIAVFAFCFALAIGALWEIAEFTVDSLAGTTMQKSGLVDTMWDLIVDAGGALFTSFIGFLYIKGGKTRIFHRILDRWIKHNPELFGGK